MPGGNRGLWPGGRGGVKPWGIYLRVQEIYLRVLGINPGRLEIYLQAREIYLRRLEIHLRVLGIDPGRLEIDLGAREIYLRRLEIHLRRPEIYLVVQKISGTSRGSVAGGSWEPGRLSWWPRRGSGAAGTGRAGAAGCPWGFAWTASKSSW